MCTNQVSNDRLILTRLCRIFAPHNYVTVCSFVCIYICVTVYVSAGILFVPAYAQHEFELKTVNE